jgi:hypothetical protein
MVVMREGHCILLQASLPVRVNMIEQNNGQALSHTQDNRPRYTGEILLRTRPKTYQRVVQLLSENTPVIQIMRLCRVAQDTVIAVRNREAQEISERKNKLATMLCDVATLGTERMMEKIPKAGLRDAAITTGIATDKMLALQGQSPVGIQIANIRMPTPEEREHTNRAHRALDEITRLLHKQEPLSEKEQLMLKAQCRVLKITQDVD